MIRMTLGEYMHAEEQADAREREIERIMEDQEYDQDAYDRLMSDFLSAADKNPLAPVSHIYEKWQRKEAELELERRIARNQEDNSQYDLD